MTSVAPTFPFRSPKFPPVGLRWRAAAIAATAVLICFVLGTALVYEEADERRHELEHQAKAAALASATSFDREVAAASFLLTGLSKAPALVNGDYRAFYDQLVATPRPEGSWFILWDANGQVLNTMRPLGSSLPRRSEWAGFEAGWNRIQDRRISVSSRTYSPTAETHVIVVAVRVDDADGRMKGFLTVNLPESRLAAILRETLLPDGWTTTVFDRNQAPAATSGDQPASVAQGMPAQLRKRAGDLGATAGGTGYDAASKSFFAYYRSAQTDFVTVTSVPISLFDAPITEARRKVGMIGLVVLCAGGIAGLLVARQVGPVETSAALMARRLRLAEARYASLWNDTPESLFVVTVTSDGRFVFEGLNPAHERATGLSFGDIVGKEPEQCLPPAVAAAVTSRYRACLDAGEPALYDEVLDLPSGRRFWQTSLAPVRDPDSGRIVTLVGTARDVTAYREATARAERSQRLLQATLDALSAHVAILNGRGDIIAVNQAWRSFGTGNGLAVPDHAIGTNYIEVCRAAAANDPRAAVVARGLAALLDGERPEFRSSYRCGDRYFQMTAAQFDHDGGVYAVVAHEDVTEMVVARHDVRDIARRLLSLQEEERQRIAADLHDSTAQHLAAAGLALMHVGGVAGNRSKVEKALEPVWLSLDKAQQEIRTLSFLLYPPGLRTEGLAASLWQLLNGFSEQTGIDGTANVSGEVDGVPFEVKRSILRVAQEALINVHRHAAATRVSLSLDLSENTLRLAVADYGKGYVTATNDGSAASSLGVGIPGMEARIRHFNGTLEIVGGQGGGTTVRATVPLQVDSF